jgi:hypothetical protein
MGPTQLCSVGARCTAGATAQAGPHTAQAHIPGRKSWGQASLSCLALPIAGTWRMCNLLQQQDCLWTPASCMVCHQLSHHCLHNVPSTCTQSWVKLTGMSRKLVYMQSKSRMLRALCEWKAITHARTRVRQRTLALRTRWGIVRQQQQLCYWHVWARYRGHLRQCEASLVQLSRRRALSSAFHQLSLGVRASRAEHILGRVRLGSTLSAWHRLTQHQGRARRVAAAAAANRVGHLLERSFHAWCLLGAWRHARLLTEDNARMQVAAMGGDGEGFCCTRLVCAASMSKHCRL